MQDSRRHWTLHAVVDRDEDMKTLFERTAGSNDALTVSVSAKVDSVSIGADGLVLNLAHLGSHPLSSIRRIG